MSSSISAGTAETVAVYQDMRTFITIYMAITILLMYDALICMDLEVLYVWQSSPSGSRKLSRMLYIYNRYISMLWNILNAGLIGTVSDASCTTIYWLRAVLDVLALLGPASFTTLRVYALSGRNKMLTGVVLLLSMGPFLVNVSTLYQDVPVNMPPLYNCAMIDVGTSTGAYVATVITSRLSLILADTAAVVITWRRTHAARRTSSGVLGRSSLEQILWANGNVYLCTLVAMNIAYMLFVLLLISREVVKGLDVLCFIDPISSTSNSRFLLDLYETNAHIESGGTSASSFSGSTLDFGGVDRAVPPELPAFLSSLAGPICSTIHDNKSETFNSYRTAKREPEAQELGAEVAVIKSPSSAEAGDSERAPA